MKVKIQEQKVVVDRLVEEARQAEAVMVAERSARHDVMARHVAEATAELRGQLAALEAATWMRLEQEPDSLELYTLDENYGRKARFAAQAMDDMLAACEFHPKTSDVLECRTCCRLVPRNCEVCGSQFYRNEGNCQCSSWCN